LETLCSISSTTRKYKINLSPGARDSGLYNPSYSGVRSGGSQFEASLGKQFKRTYLEKNPLQKELAEWFKG
jgi:hypothetical protein